MRSLISLIGKEKLSTFCDKNSMIFFENCVQNLPFSSYGMFEVHSCKMLPEIDLSLNYRQFQEPVKINKLNRKYWNDICWFMSRWNQDGTTENFHINDIWLEMDYTKSITKIFPILFCTVKNLGKDNHGNIINFIENTYCTILNEETKKFMAFFLQSLPSNSVISHIAHMKGRPNEPFRFNVKNLTTMQLEEIMAKLGYSISKNAIRLINSYSLLSDSFTLAIDINLELEKKIGIEFFFIDQNKGYSKLESFLERLVLDGFVTDNFVHNVRNWPSIEIIDPTSERYPIELLRLSRFFYPEGICSFWNIVNHIKLSLLDNKVEVKAYLAFGHTCDMAVDNF